MSASGGHILEITGKVRCVMHRKLGYVHFNGMLGGVCLLCISP